MNERELEDVWRRESPHVLAALLRRHGDLGDCEDAAQEALEAAAQQWAARLPENPRGWLITVASRRLIDRARPTRHARAAGARGGGRGAAAPAPRRRATTRSSCCCSAATRRCHGPRRSR